jgi:hypothetical protein
VQVRKAAWHLLDCSSLVEYVSSSAAARPEADADASSTSTFATASLSSLASVLNSSAPSQSLTSMRSATSSPGGGGGGGGKEGGGGDGRGGGSQSLTSMRSAPSSSGGATATPFGVGDCLLLTQREHSWESARVCCLHEVTSVLVRCLGK